MNSVKRNTANLQAVNEKRTQNSPRSEQNAQPEDEKLKEKATEEASPVKTNETIVQILASYAEQVFDKSGTKDPRQVHAHLKSLSKFYETLTDVHILNDKSEDAANLTLQSVIEMAKDVSDKMIISKVQVI